MVARQKRTGVTSPSLKRRLCVKNVRDVDVIVANISSLSLPTLVLLLVFLLLSPAFPFPVCCRHWLDGVGGERPHMADGIQEIIPGGQTSGDLSASRLKTLSIIKIIVKSLYTEGAHSVKILFGLNLLNIYEIQRLEEIFPSSAPRLNNIF